MIKLEHLDIGYNNKAVLLDSNTIMKKGEVVGLIGENGSGKSTLIKTLLKILPPINGNIYYNNKNQKEYSSREWANVIAAVSSNQERVPSIPVRELILLGGLPNPNFYTKNKSELQNRLSKIAKWLKITPLLNNLTNELSDGQIQKVFIARALMQDSPFVLFDEPTAHLDYKGKFSIFNLLSDLAHKTNKGFLVATHELELALESIDKLWLIKNGILHTGIPEEVIWEQDFYESIQTPQITFDYKQGKFSAAESTKIIISGNERLTYWVKHFVQRKPQKFKEVSSIVADNIILLNLKNGATQTYTPNTFFKTFNS